VYLVSRFGSATVRFTVRRISLLTQVLQLRLSSLQTTTVADATTIVVVVAVADAETTTSNCHSHNNDEADLLGSASFFVSRWYAAVLCFKVILGYLRAHETLIGNVYKGLTCFTVG
jgi:hypothetical protein